VPPFLVNTQPESSHKTFRRERERERKYRNHKTFLLEKDTP